MSIADSRIKSLLCVIKGVINNESEGISALELLVAFYSWNEAEGGGGRKLRETQKMDAWSRTLINRRALLAHYI